MDIFSYRSMLYYDTSGSSIASIICHGVDIFELYRAVVFANWINYFDFVWIFKMILYIWLLLIDLDLDLM
jgi:hypothetical protein